MTPSPPGDTRSDHRKWSTSFVTLFVAVLAAVGMALAAAGPGAISPRAATATSEAAAEEAASGEEEAAHRRARARSQRSSARRRRRRGSAQWRRTSSETFGAPLVVPTCCAPRRGPPISED